MQVNVEKSGKPMTGKWKIKCVYENNEFGLTNALKLDASSHTIERHISEHCPNMRNKIIVNS